MILNKMKFSFLAIIFILFIVLMGGCGSDEVNNNIVTGNNYNDIGGSNKENGDDIISNTSGIDSDAIAYLPEFINLRNGQINATVFHNGYLYLHIDEWFEAERRELLIKVALEDGTHDEIKLYEFDNDWSRISDMTVTDTGTFLFLIYSSSAEGINNYIIHEVSADGNKLREIEIMPALNLGFSGYLENFNSDNQGNLYFSVHQLNEPDQIFALDNEGRIVGRVETNNTLVNLLFIDDGDVFFIERGNSELEQEIGLVMKKNDFFSSSISAEIALADLGSSNIRFTVGQPGKMLFSDDSSLNVFDILNNKVSRIIDWLDCDINPTDILYFGGLANGGYWALNQIHNNAGERKNELVILHETTFGELPMREYLTYGEFYSSSIMSKAIINFNKSNQKYRIRMKKYAGDWDEQEAAMLHFRNDFMSGQIDLVNLSYLPFRQLVAMDAFHDLNQYFISGSLNRADYFESALNDYEIDGKLYGIMPSFTLKLLIGHQSKLKGLEQWTVQEMVTWAGQYPGSKLMDTRSVTIMNTLVRSSLDHFIDWNSGKCNFANEEFINIMEFAASFSDRYEFFSANDPDWVGPYENISTGRTLLHGLLLTDFSAMQVMDLVFDGEPQYIGYPTVSGSGIAIEPFSGSLGIAAKSPNKDGAFEFIKYILASEYNNLMGIPINKNTTGKMIESECTPRNFDENGEEGRWFPGWDWGFNDFPWGVDMYATRNVLYVDQFYDLIDRADGLRDNDQSIITIIEEEFQSFYIGQKAAWEVAEIIQNRVQIYVNEQR